MVAILYAGYSLLRKISACFITNCKNALSRQKAINEGNFAYWDDNGAYRLTSDDQQIMFSTLKNGDRIIETLDGTVIQNITKEDRDERIDKINEKLSKDNSPVCLVGRFCDVCPDKMKQLKWKYIGKKTAVYADPNGTLYFMEPTYNSNCREYMYISVDEGRYSFLSEPTEIEANLLKEKNRALELGLFDRFHRNYNFKVLS